MRTIHVVACLALMCTATVTLAQTPPELTLTRLDCGNGVTQSDITFFSDTHAYDGKTQPFTVSCYLIRHGDDIMIWDTGYPVAAPGTTPTRQNAKFNLIEELAKVGERELEARPPGRDRPEHDHAHHRGADLLAHQRPRPVACESHADADDPTDRDCHQAAQSQAPKRHLAPQQTHLDAGQRGHDEDQREHLDDRLQPPVAQAH